VPTVTVDSNMTLRFARMSHPALVSDAGESDMFKYSLCSQLTGLLRGWWASPDTVWSPNVTWPSVANADAMDWLSAKQQLPTASLRYNCTVTALNAGSVLADLTISSTATVDGSGTATSTSSSSSGSGGSGTSVGDALKAQASKLSYMMETRVNVLAKMITSGAALDYSFHQRFATGDTAVAVTRIDHAVVNSGIDPVTTGDAGSSAVDGNRQQRATGLLVGVGVVGTVGLVAGVVVMFVIRRTRQASDISSAIQTSVLRKPGQRVTQDAQQHRPGSGGRGLGRWWKSGGSGGYDEGDAVSHVTTTAGGGGKGGGGGARGGGVGGQPGGQPYALPGQMGGEEARPLSPGQVGLEGPNPGVVTRGAETKRTAGRSAKLVRNLQAAAAVVATGSSAHNAAAAAGRRHPASQPKAAWSASSPQAPEAGYSTGATTGGDSAPARRTSRQQPLQAHQQGRSLGHGSPAPAVPEDLMAGIASRAPSQVRAVPQIF
jgi:hypothetical protein